MIYGLLWYWAAGILFALAVNFFWTEVTSKNPKFFKNGELKIVDSRTIYAIQTCIDRNKYMYPLVLTLMSFAYPIVLVAITHRR